ncbi:FtsK/SpoIIIE domain-containing protein [Actinoplanes italicus]|uniref:FtsK/SpoIIIE domain-containing protein n=1 Tax=Actinoplanes italicus TaxID=113567 RepID=UPI000D063C51|nr:FtsK/SpoIIIE domain-containing protein [Actinoplanes italicus]
MDLKLSVHGRARPEDVLISYESGATVADVAGTLRAMRPSEAPAGPVTLAVQVGGRWRPVPAGAPMAGAGIVSGTSVTLQRYGQHAPGNTGPAASARLTVLRGPDAGQEHLLPAGETVVGRATRCDVRLRDPLVSKRHAVVVVGDEIEIRDLNSSNGVEVDGVVVTRAVINEFTVVMLGDTEFRVSRSGARPAEVSSPVVTVIRSPVLEPAFAGLSEELPTPPGRENRLAVPWLSILVPILLGGVLWFFSRQLLAVLFLALSPLFLIAGVLESWMSARRSFRKAAEAYRARVRSLCDRAAQAQRTEQAARRGEHPSAGDASHAALDRSPLLWSRRPGHPRFLHVRLGLATRPSRSRWTIAPGGSGDAALTAETAATLAGLTMISEVPLAAALPDTSGLGVCGDGRHDVVRGLLVQVLALHAPGEVRVAALAPASAAAEWNWLRWVPHTVGRTPAPTVLGADSSSCEMVVAHLEQLIEDRRGEERTGHLPAVVVVVDDGAPVDRGRLLAVVARGGPVGVHLIWTAGLRTRLPAACRQFLELAAGSAVFGDTRTGEQMAGVVVEGVTADAAESFARRLAPLVEADEYDDGQEELPRSAPYLDQPGIRDLLDGEALAERWAESGSLAGQGPRRRAGGLRALVGVLPGSSFSLDLREHGPHALVGGTTGSGKSAFLQSWIIGLALGYSPQRVTFLLVDYKGGTAFKGCERLPHTVGLVTDLDGHLVNRALTSLKAELRLRESLLNETGFPDLAEMERAGHPRTPPSLVIVVDEFATLVQEVPEFIDGVIDVAQRGRSLGLHLILATQRPAGVIKDNLRANTNLRVALRMADDEDSLDVIGSTQASRFPLGLPGRAVAKAGAGRTTAFQALYVAGRTSDTPPAPTVTIAPLGFGAIVPWQPPEDTEAPVRDGDTDITRLVDAVRATAEKLGLPEPRRPWLPPLTPLLDLADPDPEAGRLPFGVLDLPEQQTREVAAYAPDRDGTMLVVGTGGSGKSTTLRSLAVAAGRAEAAGQDHWQVYALDLGGGGLAPLAVLPHVGAVIAAGDHERTVRLLGHLRDTVDERSRRWAACQAGTIAEYRDRAGRPGEPRILLLLDNLGTFRATYENDRLLDVLHSIAQDGRQVGVHVVATADRPGVAPPALTSTSQRQLVLRLAQEHDLAMAGLRPDSFGRDPIPGRGFLGGHEAQVAVPGRSPSLAEQSYALQRLAGEWRVSGVAAAPPIGTLPLRVTLDELPVLCDGLPVLGLRDDTLAPIGFSPGEPLVLAGPPQSGRSSVLAALVRSLRRARPGLPMIHIGRRRSLALSIADWTAAASGDDDVIELARAWCERAEAGEEFAVIVEGIPDYLSTSAESYLQDLVTACARSGGCVIAEGDTSQLGSSWPLLQAVKTARHGIILQPDQSDGDAVLRTDLPRVSRGEFPPGRGLYVRSGRAVRVQVALP